MSDNIVILRTAIDGSRNYGNPTEHDLGATGNFAAAAERTGLGVARQLVLEIEDSSFYKNDIIALAVAE